MDQHLALVLRPQLSQLTSASRPASETQRVGWRPQWTRPHPLRSAQSVRGVVSLHHLGRDAPAVADLVTVGASPGANVVEVGALRAGGARAGLLAPTHAARVSYPRGESIAHPRCVPLGQVDLVAHAIKTEKNGLRSLAAVDVILKDHLNFLCHDSGLSLPTSLVMKEPYTINRWQAFTERFDRFTMGHNLTIFDDYLAGEMTRATPEVAYARHKLASGFVLILSPGMGALGARLTMTTTSPVDDLVMKVSEAHAKGAAFLNPECPKGLVSSTPHRRYNAARATRE